MQTLKIAYIQSDLVWENTEANLQNFNRLIDQIQEPVDLIILPETFNTAFCDNMKSLAEPVDGKTIRWMQQKSQEKKAVITGSLTIQEKGSYFNRLIWMKPSGEYDFYDKKHLFLHSAEAQQLDKGAELKTFELNDWRIRPFICYDLRFPCWCRNQYKNGRFEYDFAFFVASWPIQRIHVWNTLLQARAIENQCYVLGVNRIGDDFQGNHYQGNSFVANFKGEIISEIANDTENVSIVELDYEKLQQFRENFKVAADWDSFQLLQ